MAHSHEIFRPEAEIGPVVGIQFQPIVSLRKKSLFGLEAVAFGREDDSIAGEPEAPLEDLLARTDNRAGLQSLDRTRLRRSLEAFAPIHALSKELLLHVSLEPRLVDRGGWSAAGLSGLCLRLAIRPENLVLEIALDGLADVSALARLAAGCRETGLLLSLKGLHAGPAALGVLEQVRPDMLKLDRDLAAGIDQAPHRRTMARGLVRLAAELGALTMAAGVEREEEVLALLDLGVDILQGPHFGRPYHPADKRPDVNTAMESAALRFKAQVARRLNAAREQHKIYNFVIERLVADLRDVPMAQLDERLQQALDCHPDLECAYVLNETGLQISGTAMRPPLQPVLRRALFQPAHKGADHSLKDYFLPILAGMDRFTTETYVSLASGNPCLTISGVFVDAAGRRRILCLDVVRQGER